MASKNKEFYLNNPGLPTKSAQFEYTPHMMREIKKSNKDLLHFADKYFYIIDPDKGRVVIDLYDYQKEALRMLRDNRYNIMLTSRQLGKALDLDTPIPTPSGFVRMGDLVDGSEVYDENGQICRVIKAHDVLYDRKCFKVIFDNGEEIIADADHLWHTQTKSDRSKNSMGDVRNTQEIFNTQIKWGEPNHRIPVCINGVSGVDVVLPIDPYILGMWLGDGTSAAGSITVGKRDFEETIELLKTIQHQFDKLIVHEYNTDVFTVRVTSVDDYQQKSLTAVLRQNQLINNKHIPDIYMNSSREQRLSLLKGLIDSDGYVDKGGTCQFYNTNIKLVEQVKSLVESLGYKVTTKQYQPKLYGVDCAPAALITFTPGEEVCCLSFKRQRIKIKPKTNQSKLRAQWHYIKEVVEVESRPVRCITVDSPSSLYLCGKQYIPTHNTTCLTIYALWVACFNEDQNILIVANKEGTAIEIFRRVRLAYEHLPNWLKPGVEEWGKTSLTLSNGSRIGISTTTGSAARGTSLNVLLLDELAFVEPASIMIDFWNSVWPTISRSSTSKVLIASTPNGTDNLFYTLYDGAIKGENGFVCSTFRWDVIPGRDEKWKQSQVKALGSMDAFEQEYNCHFLQKGEASIDAETFDRLKSRCSEAEFVLEDGAYQIWKSPQEDRLYIVGVDVSEGVGQNYSVAQILDVTDLSAIEQVGIYRSNTIPPAQFTTKLNEILQHWGKPIVLIERNNCGAQVVDNLRNIHQYENIASYGAELSGRKKGFLGAVAHTNTKQRGVLQMRYWINSLKCVRFNHLQTILELKDFVRKSNATWSARGNGTDDCVMALLWALVILDNDKQYGICDQYFDIVDTDENDKPRIIKAHDYGLRYFTVNKKKYDLFGQELEQSKYGSSDNSMPMCFGSNDNQIDELADLQQMGYSFL